MPAVEEFVRYLGYFICRQKGFAGQVTSVTGCLGDCEESGGQMGEYSRWRVFVLPAPNSSTTMAYYNTL